MYETKYYFCFGSQMENTNSSQESARTLARNVIKYEIYLVKKHAHE